MTSTSKTYTAHYETAEGYASRSIVACSIRAAHALAVAELEELPENYAPAFVRGVTEDDPQPIRFEDPAAAARARQAAAIRASVERASWER